MITAQVAQILAAGAKMAEIARVLNLKPNDSATGFDPERLVSDTFAQGLPAS
jgi:hypothetical protein